MLLDPTAPTDRQTVHEFDLPGIGHLRVEIDQEGDELTRHEFYLDGEKIAKDKALKLLGD